METASCSCGSGKTTDREVLEVDIDALVDHFLDKRKETKKYYISPDKLEKIFHYSNISFAEIAERIGVSESTVRRWVIGKRKMDIKYWKPMYEIIAEIYKKEMQDK